MGGPVLLTYATRYGSTKETIESVAETLRRRGLAVEVRPTKEVGSVAAYGAVVLGAPLYIGHWLKDAHRFLAAHAADLGGLPVAVLSLGPLRAEEVETEGARKQLDGELARYPWLRPISIGLFAGKYDPTQLSFVDGLLAKFPLSPLDGRPASDARDGEAIREWAEDLAGRLAVGEG